MINLIVGFIVIVPFLISGTIFLQALWCWGTNVRVPFEDNESAWLAKLARHNFTLRSRHDRLFSTIAQLLVLPFAIMVGMAVTTGIMSELTLLGKLLFSAFILAILIPICLRGYNKYRLGVEKRKEKVWSRIKTGGISNPEGEPNEYSIK